MSGASTQSIATATGRLACEVHGQPGQPWLILAGALATDRRLWHRQLDALARTHRVLLYEHPGHGASTVSGDPGAWQLRDLANSVVSLMDALGIGQTAFVGLSIGGSVGLQLALDHPGRVTWLGCCCARADAPEPYRLMWKTRSVKALAAGMASIVEETSGRWFAPDADGQLAARLELARSMIEAVDPAGYAGCAHALGCQDILSRLGELTVDTHFLAGECDQAIPPPVIRDLHERVPGSTYTALAGAGHLANLDQPEAFTAWIVEGLTGSSG